MKVMFLLACLALADTGVVIEDVPVTPEVMCEFAWTATVAGILAVDPLTVETCEPWDPAIMYDPNLETCSFWCGSTYHLEAL